MCYDAAPPTGAAGCRVWENRCAAVQTGCTKGKFNGPPDKGALLNIKTVPVAFVPAAALSSTALTYVKSFNQDPQYSLLLNPNLSS